MASYPTIYTIQASDAPQHSDRLREILQNMETENRIGGFTVLGADDDLSSIADNLGEEDLILLVLTRQLEPHKEQIESRSKVLKSEYPEAKVAEILVDNVVYDNEFITFPTDLRPIRDREDMDATWSSIEKSLKDMFPIDEFQDPVSPRPSYELKDWEKVIIIAALIVAFLILLLTD